MQATYKGAKCFEIEGNIEDGVCVDGDTGMCKCPENPPQYQPKWPFVYAASTGPYCNVCKDLPWVTPKKVEARHVQNKWWRRYLCEVQDIWDWAENQDQTVLEHLNNGSEYFLINTPGYPRMYEKPTEMGPPLKQDRYGKYDKSIFNLISPDYPADTQTSYNKKTWKISLPEGHKIGLTMLDCDLDPK